MLPSRPENKRRTSDNVQQERPNVRPKYVPPGHDVRKRNDASAAITTYSLAPFNILARDPISFPTPGAQKFDFFPDFLPAESARMSNIDQKCREARQIWGNSRYSGIFQPLPLGINKHFEKRKQGNRQ